MPVHSERRHRAFVCLCVSCFVGLLVPLSLTVPFDSLCGSFVLPLGLFRYLFVTLGGTLPHGTDHSTLYSAIANGMVMLAGSAQLQGTTSQPCLATHPCTR